MVIKMGTPHATYLADAARRFGPKCLLSACSCLSALAVFWGGVCSTEARFCWITGIRSRKHLANSLFSLNLVVMGSFWPIRPPQSCYSIMSRQYDAWELAELLVSWDSAWDGFCLAKSLVAVSLTGVLSALTTVTSSDPLAGVKELRLLQRLSTLTAEQAQQCRSVRLASCSEVFPRLGLTSILKG